MKKGDITLEFNFIRSLGTSAPRDPIFRSSEFSVLNLLSYATAIIPDVPAII